MSTGMTDDLNRSPLADKGIRYSIIGCLAGFGGFLLWSAFAQLDEGVTASGEVKVMGNRKQVQHFEGGIIRSLNIREGDVVEQGDVADIFDRPQEDYTRTLVQAAG